jgi:DNA polymerase-1
MNLQNMPRKLKDVKRVFIPKLDAFLMFDYKNIEVRLLAFYLSATLEDDSMAKQFRENPEYDPHAETAHMLFGDTITDEQRQAGKTLNFAVIYGGATPTIMRQLKLEYPEARKLLEKFHDARPGIKVLNEELVKTLVHRGYIKNMYGRQGHIPLDYDFKGNPQSHKALNWLVQGCAADLLKESLVKVDEWINHVPWDRYATHMVNNIHDELMFDARMDEVGLFTTEIPRLMKNPIIDGIVPIEVEIEIARTSWADKEPYEPSD